VEVKTKSTEKTDTPPVLVEAIDKHWKKFTRELGCIKNKRKIEGIQIQDGDVRSFFV